MASFALRAPACGLIVGPTLVGWGDDDAESSAGTARTPLSEAELVAQADRICAEVARHFGELPDPDGGGSAKPLGLGGLIRDWVAQLRALEPPPAVVDDWHAALDRTHAAATKLTSRAIVTARRGWSDSDWDDAARRLRKWGLLDDAEELTDEGSALRASLEEACRPGTRWPFPVVGAVALSPPGRRHARRRPTRREPRA